MLEVIYGRVARALAVISLYTELYLALLFIKKDHADFGAIYHS